MRPDELKCSREVRGGGLEEQGGGVDLDEG